MADQLVLDGFVEVNGKKALNPGARVSTSDEIKVKGKILKAPPPLLYVMMNKPIQVVSTLKDPQRRATVADILPEKYRGARLFPVGRLDYFSEGLLLMTNDGDLANKLMHPRYEHEKTYEVIIRGKAEPEKLEKIRKGMFLEKKIKLRPVEISAQTLPDGNTKLIMTLRQGINRQIRRICDQFGWTILKLKRVSEASLSLGDLKPGECRELYPAELAELKAPGSRLKK